MEVVQLKSDDNIEQVAQVLVQLRAQYSITDLVEQIQKQQTNGYQIAYVQSKDSILCVAGFAISEKLAWGKHLYVDDLVTNEANRSSGAGAFMLKWLKAYCKEQGCKQLHLDSGVQKFAAHRFYLNNRFKIASHHFSITDL